MKVTHLDIDVERVRADPKTAFEALYIDLCEQMRKRGVSEEAINGIQIAMMMAFRIGEVAGKKGEPKGIH